MNKIYRKCNYPESTLKYVIIDDDEIDREVVETEAG